MKKILFSILLAHTMGNAQTSVFSEDFEEVTDLEAAGWTMYNDTNTPFGTYAATFPTAWRTVIWTAESGNTVASSTSWFTTLSPADRWLITPSITLPADSQLSLEFFARSHDVSPYDDGFKLKISTTNTAKTSFTNILEVANAVNAPISQLAAPYTVNLSAYAGQTIYLAWVNDYTNGNLLSIDDIAINATSSMGVNDVKNNINLTLYPNPASDYFSISDANDVISVKVYDISGKVIKSKLELMNDRFDISSLSKGTYIVSIETKTGIVNKKLIKK